MSAGLQFNTLAFHDALNDYAASSSRDAATILNTIGADIGFQTWKLGNARSVRGSRTVSAIENLPQRMSQRYWYRFLTKKLRAQRPDLFVKKLKAAHRKSQKTGGAISAYDMLIAETGRKIIGRRRASVGFAAMPFLKAAKMLKKQTAPTGRKFSLAKGWGTLADVNQGDRLNTTLAASYTGKNRGIIPIGETLLQQAMAGKTQEMQRRIVERLQTNGRKYSAKGARRG